MVWFFIYIAAISMVSIVVTIADKRKARKGRWRIPEATLFLLAALGGAPAMWLCMKKIRHKTKHKRFMIGLPLLFVLEAAAVFLLFYFFAPGA